MKIQTGCNSLVGGLGHFKLSAVTEQYRKSQ